MADNFVVFDNLHVSLGGTFAALDNGNILTGNFAAGSTIGLYDAAGDLLTSSQNFIDDAHGNITRGRADFVVPSMDGTFFVVSNDGAQYYYRSFNADLTPVQTADQTIVSDTGDPGAVPSQPGNAFALSDGGMGFAFSDFRSFNDHIGVLSDGRSDIERYDSRAFFTDAAGVPTTSDILVQGTGSALAGEQRSVHGVQLTNGNVAFVYDDTYYYIGGAGGTETAGAVSVSVFDTNGNVVSAPHQFVQSPIDSFGSGFSVTFGTDITALSGGGFVAAFGDAGSVATALHLQIFDASGATLGNEITLPDEATGGWYSIVGAPDGGFIVGIRAQSTGDLKLYKYDASGDLLTSTALDPYVGQTNQYINDLQIAPDGQILVALSFRGQAATDVFSVILASPGDVVLDGGDQNINDNLVGTAGIGHANWLNGEAGDDTLTGGAGENHLFGKAGNDTLIAGSGTNEMLGGDGADTAVFNGPRSNYHIQTANIYGTLKTIITDATHTDGDSTLVGVEHLQFSSSTFNLVGADLTHTANFDGHAFDDVLLQVGFNDQLIFANMEAGQVSGLGLLTSPLPGFRVAGHADINGDGFADVVVQEAQSGLVLAAEQDGSGSGNPHWVALTSVLHAGGFDFRAVGVGDLNGDGTPDVVLQSEGDAGDGSILAVTGTDANGNATFITVAPTLKVAGVIDLQVVGIGDINGDGFADVVLQDQQNPSAQILVRDLHNNNFTTYATDPGALKVVGVGDITGDGHADIILQPSGGGDLLYLDPAGGLNDYHFIAAGIGSALIAKGVADVNNDGIAEVLLQETDNGTIVYKHLGDDGFGLVAGPNGNAFHLV